MGEHSSVFEPCKYLHDNGFDVDFVPLNRDGTIDLTALKGFIRDNTSLLVFGLVNSDTGVMQDARAIADIVKTKNPNIHIHCDATQGFCKLPFFVQDLGIDSMAISAHKIHGPKGIGALWLRKGANIKPSMYGGGQQNLRPGTQDTAGIVGFAKAVEIFDTHGNLAHVKCLRERLVSNLPQGCTINGVTNNPYIVNIQLPNNIMGQTVMNALDTNDIIVGLGSACSASSGKNRTLSAMGHTDNKTKQVIRVSFSHDNTPEQVDLLVYHLKKTLDYL
jgi:cysteine desulfurase